jgi:RNA polymerase sigma-70 factor (ECF subfamily)
MTFASRDHRQYIVRLARRIGRGRLDPEDLAHDVLERWTRAAPRLPPTTNPLAWMTVVLRRLAIDELRRRGVSVAVTADDGQLPAAEPDPPPWWLELETADVTCVLGELPAALRATFQRFELEGKTYDEIASELRIAKATVGVRLLRARRKLKQLLSARHGGLAPGPHPRRARRSRGGF